MAADKSPVRGYIDGCFDIMHSGHFNAIRQAKALCDTLVVGIHSDDEIKENKALPVMRQAERYALLEHVKWIDEIVHDVPYSPLLSTLERANADFCIHGDDMPTNSQGVCAYDGMRDAGKLRIIKRTEGVSTTDLIGRLLTLARQQHEPLPFGSVTGRSTPPLGVRVGDLTADDDDRHPSVPRTPAEPVSEAEQLVNDLVAKYNISADDAAKLQRLRNGAGDGSLDVDGGLRTSAPVQLLTSTRRIAEFATSKQPQEGDKVVYVCGSFDMFHVGHAQFLKDARARGDFLLVGILDDHTVGKYKGAHLPVMHLTERVLNVCACKWADEVIIGAPWFVTNDLIKTWGIHVVARGVGQGKGSPQNTPAGGRDRFAIPREKGMLAEIDTKWPELCHETLVQRIMNSRIEYVRRNLDRAKREDAYYAQKKENSVKEA
eukprot:TRINITY_DN24_c0_g1_i1.p1 TRINITY_DN24_c0_g1~~TRINITY_DN24_c0_g1_i1.p1  ORF type:complete len:432 (+),score=105.31 TRINITY_DN24_c0_g1_i1:62-1357(+)